jgi:polyisoprenoid-binding protein YceI
MRPKALALVALLGAASAGAEPYTVDGKRSELIVKVFRAGLAKGFAHDHLVVARAVDGTVSWDPKRPEATKVSISVPVKALSADEPALRSRYGYEGALSEGDRQKVSQSMLGPEQLDAARFPTISFESTAVQKEGEALVVLGQLTLHGVTRAVRLPVRITPREGSVMGVGSLKLKTSDFGVKPYRAALGTIQNRDEVELLIRLVAVPRAPAERS